MAITNWTTGNIPDQSGRTIIITGANSGLGLEAATVLSQKGANVIMAVRNLQKGKQAMEEIKARYPSATPELMQLDLSDLTSVKKFAEAFKAKYTQLDVLMNNAGVMNPVKRELTKQGSEIQFGTNHLGHFALTGLLLDVLINTHKSRVATQSSIMHKIMADVHFDDLNWEKKYDKAQAYAQSKLSNLLFAYELDRRLKLIGSKTLSVAAHPGYTDTNLQNTSGFMVAVLNKLVAQSIPMGTLPILRAATDKNLKGGEYIGPTKYAETRGYPKIVESSSKSHNMDYARRLWEVSEKLTGVTYPF